MPEGGDVAPRFRSDNIGSWTALRARRDPHRTALVCGAERVDYAELERRVGLAAGAVREAGVKPGQRVATALKNRVEFVELLFATARAGAIFVPLNFRLSSEEVAYALADSGAELVVVQADTAAAVTAALELMEGEPPRVIAVDGRDAGYVAWREAALPLDPHPVRPQDPVSIVYTSGTTGPPKGAVLTHGGVLANVQNYLADWDLRRDDATLVVNPIFHVVLYILTVPLLYKGGKVVLMEDFDPAAAVRLAEAEEITVWFAIPTAWQMMLATPEIEALDTSRLRFVGSGGAACPQPLMDRFAELSLDYRQGYGLSETTSSATTMGPGDQRRKPGSIGRPFFHVEARIVDDEGEPLPPGGVGEIQLRGRNICAGYWRKPKETAESFDADGWFSTGDIGRADDEGFYWIVDRKKDLIISGGENISSIEVEQVVLSHPRVAEAVVIGLPHERWGETPCAVVTTVDGDDLDPAALIDHCRARIAHYKCPTTVIAVPELPKTATGKIAKPAVRELVAERVGA
ncbi:MAG TPA: long-chain fatty acid--CoA ligase [Solirubrobacterales bacterium]|nr:long-chain fatty acid--CoA ligase [Solirubrobacterales bacterium]